MNKRGIMEDWFDFIFTLLAAFLLFFLINGFFVSNISGKNVQTEVGVERVQAVSDYLIETRIVYENGQEIDIENLKKQLDNLQKFGVVNPEYVPYTGGTKI